MRYSSRQQLRCRHVARRALAWIPVKSREALPGLSAVRGRVLKRPTLPRRNGEWHATIRACFAVCQHTLSPYCDAEGRETVRYIFERVFAPIGAQGRHDLRLELLYLYKMYRRETPSVLLSPLAPRERHLGKACSGQMSERHPTPNAGGAGIDTPMAQLSAVLEETLPEAGAPFEKADRSGAKVVLGAQEMSNLGHAMIKRKCPFFAVKIWRTQPRAGQLGRLIIQAALRNPIIMRTVLMRIEPISPWGRNCATITWLSKCGVRSGTVSKNHPHDQVLFAQILRGCFHTPARVRRARRTVARQKRPERF